MADPAMPTVGDIVADKYEIQALVGEGGMGSVFRAKHRFTGKRVALKWMLPELARNEDAVHRFLREAKAAGRIAHPNVVDIYDVGQHHASYFLVMEYLHGEPLTSLLSRGSLAPEQIVDILLPCMAGVAAAHKKGVIHRDLKPDNIFLCRSEEGIYLQPKVLDFGISKLAGNDNELNPRLTRTGAVMGTPYYMSPEQIRGSHDVDGRCDVYAFGVIMYEALTGRVPFRAESYSALVLEIATGTPAMPRQLNPSLSEGLQAVLMRAMAREPRDRYQDIGELAVALEPFAGSVRYTAERMDPTGSLPQASGPRRTSSTPFSTENSLYDVPGRRGVRPLQIALGGLIVIGGAAGWLMLVSGDRARDEVGVEGETSGENEAKPGLNEVAGPGDAEDAPQTMSAGQPHAPDDKGTDELVDGVVPEVGGSRRDAADDTAGDSTVTDTDVPAAGAGEHPRSQGDQQGSRQGNSRDERADGQPDEVTRTGGAKPRSTARSGKGASKRTPRGGSSGTGPGAAAAETPAGRDASGQGSGRTGRLTVDDF